MNTQNTDSPHTPTLALPLRGAASHFKNNLHFICIVDAKERVLVSSIELEIGRTIIDACNSHAALVAALESALPYVRDAASYSVRMSQGGGAQADKDLAQARAALAGAKE